MRKLIRKMIIESITENSLPLSLDPRNYPGYDEEMMNIFKNFCTFVDSGFIGKEESIVLGKGGFRLPDNHYLNSDHARIGNNYASLKRKKIRAEKKIKKALGLSNSNYSSEHVENAYDEMNKIRKEEFIFGRQFRFLSPDDYTVFPDDWHYINPFTNSGLFKGEADNAANIEKKHIFNFIKDFKDRFYSQSNIKIDFEEMIRTGEIDIDNKEALPAAWYILDNLGLAESFGPGYEHMSARCLLKIDPVLLSEISDEDAWNLYSNLNYESSPLLKDRMEKFFVCDSIAVFAWFSNKMFNSKAFKNDINFEKLPQRY